jgi:hypothetical protein
MLGDHSAGERSAPYEEEFMLQFDSATGLLTVPVWLSASAAAVVVVLAILALARSGLLKTVFTLLVFGLAAYGGWMGWMLFERLGNNERTEERRVFDRRVAELTARATAPGSALACLDSTVSESVVTGCEKVLFGSPENVAAGVAYASARLALLVDGLEAAARSDVNYDSALNVLRRGLEVDRFGIVSYVMSQQPNCLPQQCETLALLRDPNRVRANLQDKPFEALVAKYSPQWSQVPRVSAAPPDPNRNPMAAVLSQQPAPLSSRYDLPSSASIPPVSIMNNEASQTPAPATAPTAAGNAPPAARRPPAVRAPVAARTSSAPAEPAPAPVPLAPAAPPAANQPAR